MYPLASSCGMKYANQRQRCKDCTGLQRIAQAEGDRMSKSSSENALILQDACNRLRAEREHLLDESERLLHESHQLRGGSDRLRMDSERLFAQYAWLRRRFNATCAVIGQESDHGRRLQRHHQADDAPTRRRRD